VDAPIGFSTGALALGDFCRALRLMEGQPVTAVELSALRLEELPALVHALPSLDLGRFRHVSVHAPSRFSTSEERAVIGALRPVTARGWPIVLHPDAAHELEAWRELGPLLLIENMDKRKPVGRTAAELEAVFQRVPEARLCFDIAHARQYDGTMVEAYRILRRLGGRVGQVHISEVSSRSTHERISRYAEVAFGHVARLIPASAPVIIESRVPPERMGAEIAAARRALAPAADLLRSA
jgi:sugar phosphate isomerase/epimerase